MYRGPPWYEAAFRDNEIDETVLPNLTAEDLKDLGIFVVGHRRKLLDAIAALRTGAGADADHALTHAREIGHAPSLLYALNHVLFAGYECGNCANATATADELLELAGEKGTLFWEAWGLMHKGCACALNAQPSDAVRMLTDGFAKAQITGATLWMPFFRSHLARAYIELGNFEDAWRCICEAMTMIERTTEAWCEAEVY
jgi:SAM domain (Sterile alpha motif)